MLQRSSFCTCPRHYPGGMTRCMFRSLPQPCQLSPRWDRVSFRITLFEACSAFTHIRARTFAGWLNHPLHQRLSAAWLPAAAAPVATGRSESCRRGLAPLERPCLCTATPQRLPLTGRRRAKRAGTQQRSCWALRFSVLLGIRCLTLGPTSALMSGIAIIGLLCQLAEASAAES